MSKRTSLLLLVTFAFLFCPQCGSQSGSKAPPANVMTVTSTAFEDGGMIPAAYTADGANVSPPLAWSFAPDITVSFALICDDLDGRNWVHWILFNLPANNSSLSENMPLQGTLANGARQGTNDFGNLGYGGPCPPSGTHRYYFTVYALDTILDLGPAAKRQDLDKAIKGHILAEGQLTGRYTHQ